MRSLSYALALAVLCAACAGGPPPRAPRQGSAAAPEPERVIPTPLPPVDPTPAPAPTPPAELVEGPDDDSLTTVIDKGGYDPTPTPAATRPAEDAGELDDHRFTVVIEKGGDASDAAPSLAAASRAERERRRAEGRAVSGATPIVITNENLREFSTGQLTEATVAAPPAAADGIGEEEDPNALLYQEEEYWRGRALDARLRWRNSVDAIARLEGQAEGLRRRFYAEDDPYYRDSQIKPEWDRALDLLRTAREQTEKSRIEVRDLMERGRLAGALPGWLREGLELEPQPERSEEERTEYGDIYEPEEPTILEENDGGGRD